MIVVDTNVISETMKPSANPAVVAWLNDQIAETLFLSSVTLAELLFGVGVLPAGRRKDALSAMLDDLRTLFQGRILPFDTEAAQCYAHLASTARAAGKGFPTPDGYIAAIATSRRFAVATRDIAPFVAAKVPVMNPWESRP